MTVAMSIETAAGGFADPGMGLVAANAPQGAGLFSAADTTVSSSSTTTAQSFQSRLLASLGNGAGTLTEDKTGTAAAAGAQTAGSASPAKSSDTSSATLSTTGGSALDWGTAVAKAGDLTTGTTKSAVPNIKNGSSTVNAAAGACLQVADNASPNSSSSVHSNNDSGKKDEANAGKSAKRDAATDVVATAQIATPAIASAETLAVTAPVANATVSSAVTAQSQPVQSDLSTASSTAISQIAVSSTGISQNAFALDSLTSARSGSTVEAASAAGNRAADKVETAVSSGRSTSVSTAGVSLAATSSGATVAVRDGTGASASMGTESSFTGERGASSSRTGAVTEEPSQALAQSPFQTQPGSKGTENITAPVAGAIMSETNDAASAESASALVGAEKSGLTSDRQTAGQTVLKSSSGTATAETIGHGSHSQVVATAGSSMDAAAWSRDMESAHEAGNAIHVVSGSSSDASAGQTSSEAFAALDADTGTGTPTWVHAGVQHAEAGFQDATLGWVGVRADVSGGGVHASLVSGSAEAAQMLSGHLAGLNTYLAEQHTPVETLTLTTTGSSGNDLSADQGSNSGAYQGTGQHSGQGAYTNSQQSSPVAAAAVSAEAAVQVGAGAPAATRGGTHISVMA